ncbi:MAG TPA: TraR/DksA C4-type zinc finger protein [Candidatus Paceibacterota bacterium]
MIDTNAFAVQLQTELERVTTDLSAIASFNEVTGDWVAIPDPKELQETDENSEADAVEGWNERQATVAQLEMIYHNTKRALQKITDGTYGACEICGSTIEEDRISFLPTARTCKEHRDEERTLAL